MNHQHGKFAALRERRELTASVGHAIDFVIRIGKNAVRNWLMAALLSFGELTPNLLSALAQSYTKHSPHRATSKKPESGEYHLDKRWRLVPKAGKPLFDAGKIRVEYPVVPSLCSGCSVGSKRMTSSSV